MAAAESAATSRHELVEPRRRRTRGSSRASSSGPIRSASARRRTRLLSISDARVSRSAPQTSSAASSVQPPRKIARLAKRLRSSGERRSCDQAIVARSVAWRGSASRCAGRSSRSSRRSRIASGLQEPRPRGRKLERERQAVEALAQHRHVAASARPSALTRCARSTKKVTASSGTSGGRSNRVSAATFSASRLVTSEPERRRGSRDEGRERRRHGREELLDVVEEQVGAPLADPCGDPLRRSVVGAEGLRDRRQHERRIAERRERDEDRAALGVLREQTGQLDREAGLARAAGADDGQDRRRLGEHERDGVVELALTTEEPGRRGREEHGAGRPERRVALRSELKQLRRPVEVLQPMPTEVGESDARRPASRSPR